MLEEFNLTRSEVEFEWRIANFLSLSEEVDESYRSPDLFQCLGAVFHLRIHPNGESKAHSVGQIGVYIMRGEGSGPRVTLTCTMGLRTADDRKERQCRLTRVFAEKDSGYGTPALMSRSELMQRKFHLAPSGVLTITCSLRIDNLDDHGDSLVIQLFSVTESLSDKRLIGDKYVPPAVGKKPPIIGELIKTRREAQFEWIISGFFSLPEEVNKCYETMSRASFDNAYLHLRIYPNGQIYDDSVGSIGVYLMRIDSGPPVTLDCTLGLKASDGRKDREYRFTYTFYRKASGCGPFAFISRSELMERKSELAPAGVLTITCWLRSCHRKGLGNSPLDAEEYLSKGRLFRRENVPPSFGKRPAVVGTFVEVPSKAEVEWRIVDFFSLFGESYHSPAFFYLDACLYLRIHPNGQRYDDAIGQIGVYLLRRDSGPPVTLTCTLDLKAVYGSEDRKCRFTYSFAEKDWGYGTPALISKSELVKRNLQLAPSGVLTITCSLKLRYPKGLRSVKESEKATIEATTQVGAEFSVKEPEKSRIQASTQTELKFGETGPENTEANRNDDAKTEEAPLTESALASCDDYKDMILGGQACDATVRVERHEFPVHRAVLGSRSPFFARLFHEDHQDGVVCLEDCDAQVFDRLLQFVYSGKLEDPSSRILLRLYYAADKYGLPDLKQLCVESMKTSLSEDSVCDVIHLAKLHGETHLLELATQLFTRNAEIIFAKTEWQIFLKENTTEANQLLIDLLKLRPYKRESFVTNDVREMIYKKMVGLTLHPNNRE